MSDQPGNSRSGGRRKSARISQKPPPPPPSDHSSDSSDDSSDTQIPSPPDDSDEEDVYNADADAAAPSDSDEDGDVGVPDDLDLGGREPTKSSARKSAAAHAAADTRTWIQRRKDEKARRFPEFRGAAWLLAHPPRKAFKKDNMLERSWMNRRMPFAFKNNNTRLRTSCGIELFTKRPTRDAPASSTKGKKKAAANKKAGGSKKYGDWSKPEHGANDLNMPQDFVKFLWDDGMPGESVKEPLAIEDRQVIRCDENFGTHPHANNPEHPDGFTCCETPKSHLDIYIKQRREELELEQQQEDEDKAEEVSDEESEDDDSEDESSSKKKKKSSNKSKKSRRISARWSTRKTKITDKNLLSEVYNWEDHDFVICTDCDDQQLNHLTTKAEDGHFHGALVPLCQECSLAAVKEYGFGYNGCGCDQERRCLNHRIEHLEQLTDVREDYIKKHQPKGDHPALRMYNKLFKKADKKESAGDEDFDYPEVTPICPNCEKNFPPPVPTHFAYNCRRCDEELVIPAPEDLEGQWQDICEQPQSFVKNVGRPVERSLAMLDQKWDWNKDWVAIFKRYAANPLPEDVESEPGNVADNNEVDNDADSYADAAALAEQESDSDDEKDRDSLLSVEDEDEDEAVDQLTAADDNQGLTAEEEYHLNVAGAMHPAIAVVTAIDHPAAAAVPADTPTTEEEDAATAVQSAPTTSPSTTPPLPATPVAKRKRDAADDPVYRSPGVLRRSFMSSGGRGRGAAMPAPNTAEEAATIDALLGGSPATAGPFSSPFARSVKRQKRDDDDDDDDEEKSESTVGVDDKEKGDGVDDEDAMPVSAESVFSDTTNSMWGGGQDEELDDDEGSDDDGTGTVLGEDEETGQDEETAEKL